MKINAFFKKIKLVFKKLFNSNKKMFVLSVLLCFVVLLLFFSSLSSTNKTTTKSSSKITNYTVSEYSSFIENKIEEMIFSTGKVNRVSAFVMVESTPEIKYLTETDKTVVEGESGLKTTTSAVTVVFQKDGSMTTPVVVATLMPKIKGVMIVLSKIDASTKLSIQKSLSIVLNIDESSISILQES